MRPPDLPGGNLRPQRPGRHRTDAHRFNEAAGFTRRKQRVHFNRDAAGRLASMRPPDLPGGNSMMRVHAALVSTLQ